MTGGNEYYLLSAEDMAVIDRLQSLITVYTDSRQAARIGRELFDVSEEVMIEDLHGNTRRTAEGRQQVLEYWEDMDRRILLNGNTLGSDLSVNRRIIPLGPGLAAGSWDTYTVEVLGPAYGIEALPYPYRISAGHYENTFVRTPEGWKIRSLTWKPLVEFDPYSCEGDKDGVIRQNIDDWPQPYELYPHAGTYAAATSEEDILYCDAVMAVKNLAGRIAQAFTAGSSGLRTLTAEEIFTEGAELSIQGLPETLKGREELSLWLSREIVKADHYCGCAPVILLTTAVAEPFGEGYTKANASWMSLTLEPFDKDGMKVLFRNKTCRWMAGFEKTAGETADGQTAGDDGGAGGIDAEMNGGIGGMDQWKISSLRCVTFSTMSDMKGRRTGA
ncbi:MAG: nuclear transport factor 2 family protein [Lachnospiraceae bacterium]|nr:nuclear transport factor 2 family protein [Lachnospiraceae bacterium]